MKNDGVNRDTGIEVGDLVRVVGDIGPHDPGGFAGNDFIVEQVEDKQLLLVGANGHEWWFYPQELEIMQEASQVEANEDQEKYEDDCKKCYEILKDWYERTGYIDPEELIEKLNGMGWDKG